MDLPRPRPLRDTIWHAAYIGTAIILMYIVLDDEAPSSTRIAAGITSMPTAVMALLSAFAITGNLLRPMLADEVCEPVLHWYSGAEGGTISLIFPGSMGSAAHFVGNTDHSGEVQPCSFAAPIARQIGGVLTVDYPPYSMDLWVAFGMIRQKLEHYGCEKLVVWGDSFGGAIGYLFCQWYQGLMNQPFGPIMHFFPVETGSDWRCLRTPPLRCVLWLMRPFGSAGIPIRTVWRSLLWKWLWPYQPAIKQLMDKSERGYLYEVVRQGIREYAAYFANLALLARIEAWRVKLKCPVTPIMHDPSADHTISTGFALNYMASCQGLRTGQLGTVTIKTASLPPKVDQHGLVLELGPSYRSAVEEACRLLKI